LRSARWLYASASSDACQPGNNAAINASGNARGYPKDAGRPVAADITGVYCGERRKNGLVGASADLYAQFLASLVWRAGQCGGWRGGVSSDSQNYRRPFTSADQLCNARREGEGLFPAGPES